MFSFEIFNLLFKTISDCDSAGTATAVVKGVGLYTGKQTVNYVIIPDTVKNLSVTKVTSDSATLGWKAVTGAEGYFIYRYNSTTKKWVRISSATACKFTDKDLTSGATYKYRVRAYNKADNKYYLGNFTASVGAVTNPERAECTAVSTKKGTVTVSWEKLAATGYEIVMSDTGEKNSYKLVTDTKNLTYNCKTTSTSLKFVRVRGYRVVNGVKQYGLYSKTIMVAVK